jgi:hypothetical protein
MGGAGPAEVSACSRAADGGGEFVDGVVEDAV